MTHIRRGGLISSLAIGIVLVLALGAVGALADTYQLTTPNSGLSGYPSPYADVSITLDVTGKIATVTFTADTSGGHQYLFTDGGSAAININATTFTYSTATGTNP